MPKPLHHHECTCSVCTGDDNGPNISVRFHALFPAALLISIGSAMLLFWLVNLFLP